jgi:hypothetical protein
MSRLVNLRRHRERQRLGVRCFKLPLNVVNVEEMLIREGLLSPLVDHSHGEVEAALAEFVTRLAETAFPGDADDVV